MVATASSFIQTTGVHSRTVKIAQLADGENRTLEFKDINTAQFDFDLGEATFVRTADSLQIRFDTGGVVTVQNFFSLLADVLPDFVLPGGETVAAADFFTAYYPDIDISTAAGAEGEPSSNGLSAYEDVFTGIISGVTSMLAGRKIEGWDLGARGSVDLAGVTDEIFFKKLDNLAQGSKGHPNEKTPFPGLRIVMYGNSTDQAEWEKGVTTDSLEKSGIEMPGAGRLKGLYGVLEVLEDGSFAYYPSKLSWENGAKELVDRIEMTLPSGERTVVEVVLVKGSVYGAVGREFLQEWHEGKEEGRYLVTAGFGHDVLMRQDGNIGLGKNSHLVMEAGNDTVTIKANDQGGIKEKVYGLDHQVIVDMGEGDNLVDITASNKAGDAYGVLSYSEALKNDRTAVIFGGGNDTLRVTVSGSVDATGVYVAKVDLGDGDNLVKITGQAGANGKLCGILEGETVAGSGNDTLSFDMKNTFDSAGLRESHVDLGGGDNLIAMAGVRNGIISAQVVTGSGNDSIVIDTSSLGTLAKYGISGYTSINTGAGNDLVKVTMTGAAGGSEGMRTGSLSMGDGNDTFIIDMKGTAFLGAMNDPAEVLMGSGDDLVDIKVNVTGGASPYLAFGMHNFSSIDLGDGDDTLKLNVRLAGEVGDETGSFAYGLANNAAIRAGNGNDAIDMNVSISVLDKWSVEAKGLANATIFADSGDDTLTMQVSATGQNASAYGISGYMQSVGLDMDQGNDSVSFNVSVAGSKSAKAVAIYDGSVNTGDGNDTVVMTVLGKDTDHSDGVGAEAAGLLRGKLELGSGDDSVQLNVSSDGDAYGITHGPLYNNLNDHGSEVFLGAGNDILEMHVVARQSAYGIKQSEVFAGDGDDTVDVRVSGKEAIGLMSSTIDMGSGNNLLRISVDGENVSLAMKNGLVSMGGGDDTLFIKGGIQSSKASTGSGNDILEINGTLDNSSIDAGSGDDLIRLGAGFLCENGSQILGGDGFDVLQFAEDLHTFDFRDVNGKISGIEQVDLTKGGHSVTFCVADVLNMTRSGEVLRVVGNEDDHVILAGGGWSVSQDTVRLATAGGEDELFYTVSNEGATLYVDINLISALIVAG